MMKLIFYSAVYIIFHFEDLFKLQYSTLYLKNFVFKGPYIKKKTVGQMQKWHGHMQIRT